MDFEITYKREGVARRSYDIPVHLCRSLEYEGPGMLGCRLKFQSHNAQKTDAYFNVTWEGDKTIVITGLVEEFRVLAFKLLEVSQRQIDAFYGKLYQTIQDIEQALVEICEAVLPSNVFWIDAGHGYTDEGRWRKEIKILDWDIDLARYYFQQQGIEYESFDSLRARTSELIESARKDPLALGDELEDPDSLLEDVLDLKKEVMRAVKRKRKSSA